MSNPVTPPQNQSPRHKVFEANFPMNDHICDGKRYRLESKEKTGREIGGREVIKYVFSLVEEE